MELILWKWNWIWYQPMMIVVVVVLWQLLGKLHASVETAQENISFNSALHPLADDIQTSLATHLQSVGDNLVRCAVSHCSSDMSSTSFNDHLKKSIENKSLFPVNVIKNTVLDNTTLPLVSQFNELSMAMCSQICDTVIEEVIQSLSLVYKSLVSGRLAFARSRIVWSVSLFRCSRSETPAFSWRRNDPPLRTCWNPGRGWARNSKLRNVARSPETPASNPAAPPW